MHVCSCVHIHVGAFTCMLYGRCMQFDLVNRNKQFGQG